MGLVGTEGLKRLERGHREQPAVGGMPEGEAKEVASGELERFRGLVLRFHSMVLLNDDSITPEAPLVNCC